MSSTTVVVAPAYSPFGFGMPFGGFGYGGGFGMPMFMPFGFFSSILSFMALALVLSVVVNVVKVRICASRVGYLVTCADRRAHTARHALFAHAWAVVTLTVPLRDACPPFFDVPRSSLPAS